MPKVKVAVVGYGMIGCRCADAVAVQPDMELVGVADAIADYRVKAAAEKGYSIYASPADRYDEMSKAGLELAGTIDDLLKETDVIIDATPRGIGAKMKPVYERAGIKAIFQGGEKHEVAGHSFVAQANYEKALGRQFTRVVSCNTTGTVRVMNSLWKAGLIKRAWGVLCRRGTDPWKAHKSGVTNTFVPETHIPSHQGPDAKLVVPGLPVTTIAAKGPYTLSHIHFWIVEAPRDITKDEVLDVFRKTPRVALIEAADGIIDLASTIELMKHLGRPRGDMWEAAIWRDILTTEKDCAYIVYQVHNLAIVVPENIDAVRALTETETDPMKSIEKTDKALGIKKEFFAKLKA
jgi:glyceraldehyde-3-phosphate dehydrogenase (NAD(P))